MKKMTKNEKDAEIERLNNMVRKFYMEASWNPLISNPSLYALYRAWRTEDEMSRDVQSGNHDTMG